MIEKFSDEELKQIMKELGIKEKKFQKHSVVLDERKEIKEIFKTKPRFTQIEIAYDKAYFFINGIVSLSLNCLTKKKDGYYKISPSIEKKDVEEYKQMFREILGIIKKHNREWEPDISETN